MIDKLKEYIDNVKELDSVDIDYLFKVVDIYKDLKEVECMYNYDGRGPSRGSYGEEYREYGRRGVDSRYKASKYMDGMRGSYEAYEEAREEYNRGNYGAKDSGLRELEYMLHALVKFAQTIREEATSPEEQEIVRKHFMKISEYV